MAEFKEIDESRRLLRLDEHATLSRIKKAYRKQARQYHPDKCREEVKKDCEEMFKKISCAHDILTSYCADKEFYDHLRRFYDGWWGDLGL